jgi:RNA-directed DNA polymerase
MQRRYPHIPFERYADDAICHCANEAQALELRQALEARFAECRLRVHPQKTRIVYCKDANRPGKYPEQSFDFLGYTFRPREASGRNRKRFVSFSPAASAQAAKRMRQEVRKWRLHRRSDLELEDIAGWVRPILAGWVRYYGRFYPSELREQLRTIDAFIVRWVRRKYKRSAAARWRRGNGYARFGDATRACSLTGRWDARLGDGSRVNREVHARFCESAELQRSALLTYLKGYADGQEAKVGIGSWIAFYNHRRPHQSLADRPPMTVWRAGVTGELAGTAVDMTLRLDNAVALPTSPQPPQQQPCAA